MDLDSEAQRPRAEPSAESQRDEQSDVYLIKEGGNIPEQADGFITKNFGNFDSKRAQDGCPKGG